MDEMPEEQIKFREVWNRGKEYHKSAKDGADMILLMIMGGLSVLALGFNLYGLKLSPGVTAHVVTTAEIVISVGSIYYVFWHRPFSDMIKLERKIEALEGRLVEVVTPRFEISCAQEGDGSVSRDWPVRYEYLPKGGTVVPQIRYTDFFGFSIRTIGTKTVKNLTARITKVRRLSDSEEWRRPIALSFEPETITKKEPIEVVDLWHTEWQACAVCSVREEPDNVHVIMAGSINMTSRYGTMFERFFEQKGKYVFYVSIRADDLPTNPVRFLFDWKGTRQESEISMPASRSSLHEAQNS